jgi:hypothetical protein
MKNPETYIYFTPGHFMRTIINSPRCPKLPRKVRAVWNKEKTEYNGLESNKLSVLLECVQKLINEDFSKYYNESKAQFLGRR